MSISLTLKETQDQIKSIERRLSDVRGGGSGITIPDENVLLDRLGASTYTNLHDFINNTQSSCRISGGEIIDSGGGEIDVDLGTGILKIIDSALGCNVQFDWARENNLSLTNQSTNWIGIEYNAGAPQVKIETILTNFNFHNDFVLGRVYRDGNTVYILNAGSYYSNFQHRVCYRFFDRDGFHRAVGAVIASAANLDFSITEGRFYCGTTAFTTGAFDCSGADTFTYWYRDGGVGWTTAAGTGTINNANYDDGDGVLGNLTANRYGVHWVYLCHDGSVHVQYGQGDYRLNEAETALVPATSDFMTYNCKLVGKIISQQGNGDLIAVSSAFEETFIGATVSVHNELGGLQGGQANQYYHLTAGEHGYVSGVNAQSLLTTASPHFAGLTLTGNIVMPDGGTIGQAVGPLLTFDDTNNYLEITGCNVGIGTATPHQKLQVSGSMIWLDGPSNTYSVIDRSATDRRGVLCFVTAGDPSEAIPATGLQWCVGVPDSNDAGDGSEFFIGPATSGAGAKFWIETNGFVGINTLTPDMRFDVEDTTTIAITGTAWRIAEFKYNAGDKPGIFLGFDTAGAGIIASSTQATGNAIAFWTYTGASWGERMRITKDGDVNIHGANKKLYLFDNNSFGYIVGGTTLSAEVPYIAFSNPTRAGFIGGHFSISAGWHATLGTATSQFIGFLTSKVVRMKIARDGGIFAYNLKSGANQAAAGAAVDELWHDTDDETIKLGV